MVNNVSPLGHAILLAILVAIVAPFWMLLPKFGLSKWLSLFALTGMGALLLLWIMALRQPAAANIEEVQS